MFTEMPVLTQPSGESSIPYVFEKDDDIGNCYSTAKTFKTKNAFYIVGGKDGSQQEYDQECIGVIQDGVHTNLTNWSSRYVVSYTDNTLSLKGGVSNTYSWIKIYYEPME